MAKQGTTLQRPALHPLPEAGPASPRVPRPSPKASTLAYDKSGPPIFACGAFGGQIHREPQWLAGGLPTVSGGGALPFIDMRALTASQEKATPSG